ncbi:MAG: GNAT family N-acetyltransferase [Nitrospira sp.]|nr:GNAT family N-acetyltransferase [Nitrospira sp.]
MASQFSLRDFQPTDAAAVDALVLSAFHQYRAAYSDWPAFSSRLGQMVRSASHSEIIVAESGGAVVGAVAYVGAGQPQPSFYPPEWPMLRMLVVDPSRRGLGIGRALTADAIGRAVRDRAPLIALHTSPIMKIALPLFERMGFRLECDIAPIFGVPYVLYVKPLGA